MNFGPLNRQGGERRLNVAITRAKEQVVVFSSIHANQIELSRTNAVGAAHLKYFLEYAEKKLNLYTAGPTDNFSDGFRDEIADFLTGKGYQVEKDAGCSGFRIDIAVRHPEKPEEFLLGIECDNSAYAAQNTARDRDNLRHQVLQGLGWNIYRVWCVDWTFDRDQAERALLEFIENIKNEKPEQPSPEERTITSDPVPEITEQEVAEVPVPENSGNRKVYQIWSMLGPLDQDNFYEPSGKQIIKKQVDEIIELEAPIYDQVLKKRIARAWGFTRTGGNIQRILDSCLPAKLNVTNHGEDKVYWAEEQIPEEYSFYRVPNSDENHRSIDEIPPEELANAMFEILTDFNSCDKDILYRETVKLFGLAVVTAKARKYLDYGFSVLQKSGRIR